MPRFSVSGSGHARAVGAACADLCLLVVFAILGRRAHGDDGSAVAETLTVAAPFLIGYAIAAAALRLDRDPLSVRRGGAVSRPIPGRCRLASNRGTAEEGP